MTLLMKRISDDILIERINAAQVSVVLYAPGVSERVADSLCAAIGRLNGRVKIAFDVSEMSVRMGFLDKSALWKIWHAKCEDTTGHVGFFVITGLRMGSLFIDGKSVLLYPSVSTNFEEENVAVCSACPNAVELGPQELMGQDISSDMAQIPVTIDLVQDICGAMSNAESKTFTQLRTEMLEAGREEGLREGAEKIQEAEEKAKAAEDKAAEAVKQAEEFRTQNEQLKKDLEKKKEDVIKEWEEKVKIRRVEFSVTECQLNGCNLALPAKYLTKQEVVRDRLKARYQLFDKGESLDITAEYIFHNEKRVCSLGYFAIKVKEVRSRLVFSAGSTYGNFIFGDEITRLHDAIDELKLMAQALKAKLPDAIRKKAEAKIDDLFKDVYPIMKAKPSAELQEIMNCAWRGLPPAKLKEKMREYFIDEMKDETDKAVNFFSPDVVFDETIYPFATLQKQAFRDAVAAGLKRAKKFDQSRFDEIFAGIPPAPEGEKK